MHTTLMTRFLLIGWIALTVSTTQAQEIRKTLRDFRWDHPFVYQPNDPFVRSKAYQIHTKHYGMFYNCDNEECKRYSPHICWKTHWENDLPNWKRPLEWVRDEVCQVKQRVADGAGACANIRGCQCQQCQQVEHAHPQGCGCQHCAQAPAPSEPVQGVRVAARSGIQVAPVSSQEASGVTRAGLIVSRPALEARSPQQVTEPAISAPLMSPTLMERLTLSRQQGSTAPALRPTRLETETPRSQPGTSSQRWMR